MNDKFAVIGLGMIGTGIARSLAKRGAEVIAIDADHEKVEYIKDEVALAVALNSTDKKALQAQNLEETDAVVVAMGHDFEDALLTAFLLKEMGCKRIIARVSSKHQKTIFNQVGIDETFAPDEEVGKTVAERLIHPDIEAFLPLPDDHEIIEVRSPKRIVNKTVQECNMREKYSLNLVTIKRTFEEETDGGEKVSVEHLIGVPRSDTRFNESDILILLGKTKDVDRFIEVNR